MCTINEDNMIYGSWDIRHNKQFFVILAQFLPFNLPNNLKNQNFEKVKKKTEKIIILHLHTTNNYHMIYVSWDVEHSRHNFFSLWTIFCPFTPLATQKIKILKQWKKMPGNIIISHKCTINDNHMMYDSWDMKHDRQNVLSFWAILCPFTSLTDRKIKMKKYLEISSFYNSIPKIMIIWNTVPETWHMTDVIVILHFGLFFCPLPPPPSPLPSPLLPPPPPTAQKIKIS